MNEQDLRTRTGVFGIGILLALVVDIAHPPFILIVVPLVILFLGMVAVTEELHAAWYGVLSTIGIFDPAILSEPEREAYSQRRHYFWFGEVASAAVLAGVFAVPAGIFLDEKTGTATAFTGAAMIFLLLFIFLPKLIRQAMKTDTETILEVFGKNEQFRKVFWTVFVALASLVLAQVVDPETARLVVGAITGMGV
ncbi:MAG: hypothetical protein EHM53_13255 [Methanoregulaceae archaeon]|nr:MAG: hypothetical protein EHM53_13255 [Methanoregulaceae archaeon]